ncbi:MAG: HAD family hydrolase [Vulcanimicrobiota bacterium]
MPQAVIFDFAETLAHLEPDKGETLQNFVLERGGPKLDAADIGRAFKCLEVTNPYSSVEIRKNEQREHFYRLYNRHLFQLLGVEHLVSSDEYYTYAMSRERRWQLSPHALPLLRKLKTHSVPIYLASNFDSRLRKMLQELKISEYFEKVLISQEMMLEKPDLDFYRAVLEATSLPAPSVVYIGDSYSLDFLPARQTGFAAYLLDPLELYPHLDFRISSLDEVDALMLSKVSLKDCSR